MKITDQINAIDRAVIIITDGKASPELSEFFEHLEDRINLSFVGTGTPEGVSPGDGSGVTAPIGSIYHRLDDAGGAGTMFYVKESGTGNTGWAAK